MPQSLSLIAAPRISFNGGGGGGAMLHYIVICKNWLFKLFYPQYYKSDMSKYGYLELFLRVPSILR